MNCIDAIEGTVKCILNRIHEVTLEDHMDDSEYVRSIKAVIDATDDFVEGNQEIVPDRNLLKNVLYSYSKDLWRNTASDSPEPIEPAAGEPVTHKWNGAPPNDVATPDDDGYRDYYFDYLYRHGVYPR